MGAGGEFPQFPQFPQLGLDSCEHDKDATGVADAFPDSSARTSCEMPFAWQNRRRSAPNNDIARATSSLRLRNV